MRTAAVAALLAAACSARPLDGAASSGSGDGSGSDASNGSASSGQASSTDEGPSLENCGDGKLDPGEQCDDGNDVDADGCNVDCVVSGSVRWSMQMDDVRCSRLAADRQGGVFMSGSSEPNLYWIARIAEPGEVVWQTADGRLPGPLIGLSDGVLAGWEYTPNPPQGLVLAYDGSGMVRSETVLDDPDVEALTFLERARVADGQDPVLVTDSDLTDGAKRLTFWGFDTDGKMVGPRVVAEGANHQSVSRVAITSDGRIVLAASDHLWAYAPSGHLMWERTLPDTYYLYDLDSTSDGSLYAVSMYAEDAEGPYVLLVERHAPDGSLGTSWVHGNTNEGDQGVDALLAVDGRDDVLVAGRFFDETEFRYTGLRLVKYSSEGEPRWSQWWEASPGHSSNSHDPNALAIAANGDTLLAFEDPTDEHPERCHIVAVAP